MLAVYLINPGRKEYAVDSVLSEFLGRDMSGDGETAVPRGGALHLARAEECSSQRLDSWACAGSSSKSRCPSSRCSPTWSAWA